MDSFSRVLVAVVAAWWFAATTQAFPYDPSQVDWNLNQVQGTYDVLNYSGVWENHTFNPSPDNWRMPTYTVSLDRYADGNPSNNEANGTQFEYDWMSNQFRFGGDVKGLMNDLDYIQGMGIKTIYLMGSPFINMPWAADSFSPLDLTIIDHHHGSIEEWRELITAIHERDMYIILDNTMGTLGDLIGFEGSMNETAAFEWGEYDYGWKTDRRYVDFTPGNDVVDCTYPRMWDDTGSLITVNQTTCRDSEFDSYGDLQNIGSVAVYKNQLAKYGSVQDRLREWRSDVLDKIKHLSCMEIAMLDIDGFRMDKALQTTVDAMASFSDHQRQCARKYGKENFLIIGEIVGTDQQQAVYIGRGKEPGMYSGNSTASMMLTNVTADDDVYIRESGLAALDAAAFTYTIYGALTRVLGLSGYIGIEGTSFVQFWTDLVLDNDFINSNTGLFDPRHMMGTTTQDVFRWPAIANGTQRQLLGQFITYLILPGSPMLYWGEEQALYIVDSTASNYIYGRQPMSSSRAWQLHGCYKLGDDTYTGQPLLHGPAAVGCEDNGVSLDHKDPSHPTRNVLKRFFELRQQYPVLNDGWGLQALSNQTTDVYLEGSGDIPTPFGMWSIYRHEASAAQDLSSSGGQADQGVWLLYSNLNYTEDFSFDCQSEENALVAPFAPGTTVMNLLYPYDVHTVENTSSTVIINGTTHTGGCMSNLTLEAWGYKAFVPVDYYSSPKPSITQVVPSHDERVLSTVSSSETQTVRIEIHFSQQMDCTAVQDAISVNSSTLEGTVAQLDSDSVACSTLDTPDATAYSGQPAGLWKFTATLENVAHGIHTVTITNATSANGTFTGAVDRFMFRLGSSDNPIIFPLTGNYSTDLLHKDDSTGDLYITQRAAGADKFRYSLTYGSSWSDWLDYTTTTVNRTLESQAWSGTSAQAWSGEHVMVQYWSSVAGSATHMQHGDLSSTQARRWPHAHVMGEWNTWGFDGGLASAMHLAKSAVDFNETVWAFGLAAEWPTQVQINIWGMDPDGQPDKTMEYGDVDGDNVLDWLPPNTLASNVINITEGPGMPHVGWRIEVNDGSYRYNVVPTGNAWHQLALSFLLALIPVLTGGLAVWIYFRSYYTIRMNQIGTADVGGFWGRVKTRVLESAAMAPLRKPVPEDKGKSIEAMALSASRRTTLIATMEYEIDDWNIKIKIGGLGKMASLMGSEALAHQNLIWVVPCVGGIDYPADTPAEPMIITINKQQYIVSVQYHVVRNITYVLLDAPVFRQRTKSDPYPPRMDDIESAIYYSAWNACIAEAIKRFPVDLYYINDYHGTLAPLYLLPRTIPVSLALHNAEFQGLWALRSKSEMAEVCDVFNLPKETIKRFAQFDKVFNMLYAGASYLREFQGGYGAVGVSKKYGSRAYKRYPIFWGLSEIGSLPNPDPDDMADFNTVTEKEKNQDIVIDEEAEKQRGALREQAQQWAGLNIDPTAELFVFVGRWSLQKGVDLIADVFPAIMDKHKNVQLICIGPTIDNHGRFAALKLEKMMHRYPGRVYSKPEFTPIPSFVHSGAEFALMPSRDEPFGLVAVEFGRKGALGVGSRVGGLGSMPGWWFTIESTETKHLLRQFKSAIKSALASSLETRKVMRARSLLQRFPVVQWVHDLEILQSQSIRAHSSIKKGKRLTSLLMPGASASAIPSGSSTPIPPPPPVVTLPNTALPSPNTTAPPTAAPSIGGSRASSPTRARSDSFGAHSRNAPYYIAMTADSSETASGAMTPASLISPATPRFASGFPRNKSATAMGHLLASRLTALAEFERTSSQSDLPQAYPSERSSDGASEIHSSRHSGLGDHGETVDPYWRSFFASLPTNNASVLSLDTVVGERKDFQLQKVEPFFNDPKKEYYNTFGQMLDAHDGSLSSDKLCVEGYIRQSEKDWFEKFYDAKLGKKPPRVFNMALRSASSLEEGASNRGENDNNDEFNLGPDYAPPTGLKKFLLVKIGEWPLYAYLLAMGQILSANSYQITLLTGQNGQSAEQVYITSGIYLGGSIFWWLLFRRFQLVIAVSLAFVLYGTAFFVLAICPYAASSSQATTVLHYLATALYAVASSSGFLFFTQNFLTEGGNPVKTWMFRACTIQGTQQIYIAALWYWGTYASTLTNEGSTLISSSSRVVTAVCIPIAVLLWAVATILFVGLPDAYRRKPGYVSAFYRSLLRRKVVVWFLVAAFIQNYFLSTQYGRSWSYLWNSSSAPAWAIALLILLFFVVVWAVLLAGMAYFSTEHSWLLPIVAIGLGAPRWAQELWGTSGVALYMPWAGAHVVAGALLGRCLWLWLGVLDTLQGVGFGMILLQTLGRFHVSWAVLGAQVIGSAGTILARATAPDKIGPGSVFPNLAMDLSGGVNNVWFWVPLLFQLAVCVGFFVFFRKEQLMKP
ncbi:family 5 glycosyltransferase [Cryphonectria parasitica EP155]|uniref:alpha-1,3-glucan synthase n=1 Tax=Cryphonectria parasitica (strain ATCC 38755 / EP155) TaxID=660469 RepID=A0A9P4Y3G7_CRYP1|nr:family 5 glycosyltransferase [Cryphonectria parasitica EP155]KAF3766254.1 family 5 glycosyltransferase [Cryphonectria parasitica EP155]